MNKKTIRVGLIGLGKIGKTHARCYQTLSRDSQSAVQPLVTAVLRPHPDRDVDFLEEIGSPMVTASADEFFASQLDMVDICTPNDTHETYNRRACQAGMHVYCEKPLGRDLSEARRMLADARQAGVSTQTAFIYRYIPALKQMQQAVQAGDIGHPLHFRLVLYHSGYLDPERPSSWRLRHADSGGGALADLGIHLIDMSGMVLGDVDWVQCVTGTFITSRPSEQGSPENIPVDVDDWAVCTIGLKNGAAGTLEVSRMAAGMQDFFNFDICGDRGSLRADFDNLGQARLFRLCDRLWVPTDDTAVREQPVSHKHLDRATGLKEYFDAAHMACIEDFLNNLLENKPGRLNFETACKAQQVLEAAYRSAATSGQRIWLSSLN